MAQCFVFYFAEDAQANTVAPFVFPWSSPAGNDFLKVHQSQFFKLNRLA